MSLRAQICDVRAYVHMHVTCVRNGTDQRALATDVRAHTSW